MNGQKCTQCGAEVTGDYGSCLLCGVPLDSSAQERAGGASAFPGSRQASALDMEILALTISAGQRAGLIQGHQADSLRAELMAADTAGIWWTFVSDSRRWFRSEAGSWVAAEAPEEIYLAEDIFDRLQRMTRDALERMGTLPAGEAVGPRPKELPAEPYRPIEEQTPTRAEARETPRFCGKCGQTLRPGKLFCVGCGTPVTFGVD